MFRLWIILLFLLTFARWLRVRPSAGASWKTVTPQELKMTAADIGDPEADAANAVPRRRA